MVRDPTWLLQHKRDVHSQTGEDGIIEAILSAIGVRDRWCVEFGAWDGQHLSNTRHLIESHGYHAVQIEGDAARCRALRDFHAGNDRIVALQAFVGFDKDTGLDALLQGTPVPADFDFLSIDIDGNDYHVWHAVRRYRPKLVVIEFNPTMPNACHFVQAADPAINQGSSLAALTELAGAKGYQLACALQFNAFFVRNDLFPCLGISDNSPETLRTDLSQLTFLFQGFDGTMFLHGNRRMSWHDMDIGDAEIQQLPALLRKFPSAYSATEARLLALFKRWRKFRRRLRRLTGAAGTGPRPPDPAVPTAPADSFLLACRGVLHVGANSGQERETYARLGLPVVWVEALPRVFAELQANIAPYPDQIAICALLADRDGQPHRFRVANNDGASSSILELKHHRDIWPEVQYIEEIPMESATLPTVLAANGIDGSRYDALVMDTQGSEQLILQGAGAILDGIRYIKTEAADFESYENCATVASLTEYLGARGFRLTRQDRFATHPSLGAYYDILFEKAPG